MSEADQSAFKDFLNARTEIALLRLRNNPAYLKRYHKQLKRENQIEILILKLKKRDCNTINHYIEDQTLKQNFELEEVYLQGMRDCLQIFSFLNAFDTDVRFNE